ncbi:MAG: P-type conjugative transfer protein TrbG [Sphingobium sp.]|nr:P-type conjugative transfer protein TrbG [Sphingobium sp.]MBP6111332.1 P-type conjugative transfer protein TrbG [Sphingobium sp.]MBP8671314.1 P-type conjugative transfer protein TrbG [Sphingobium sp.]MBP9156650.1 P-type conjugative transfer protein TrbG [Sphingobium sp.]MCC6483169.1 P-type conjugative transfer protein TrbG [Sphingomonadaceae bacterium]
MKFLVLPSLLALGVSAAHGQTPQKPAVPTPAATTTKVPAPVAAPATKPSLAVHHYVRPRRHVPSPVVLGVARANRAATREPSTQGFINAVQVYAYSEGAIYQLYAAPGTITDIALQPGENLIAVASGDTVRWVIGDTISGSGADKRTHILVKPFASGLSTNLVITTDRRSYHLQLRATSRTAMAALSWVYPADQLIALKRTAEQAEAAAPVAQGLAIDQLHFNYQIGGDKPAWLPLRAFDDGRQTFVEFPESIAVGEAPPLFVIGPSGDAELVNYRVRGRFYIIDRLFDVAELRLGTKKQQIVRIERVAEGAARRKGQRS